MTDGLFWHLLQRDKFFGTVEMWIEQKTCEFQGTGSWREKSSVINFQGPFLFPSFFKITLNNTPDPGKQNVALDFSKSLKWFLRVGVNF